MSSEKWKKNYTHHSNPANRNDFLTFFDKCLIRPKKEQAWRILKNQMDGDRQWAREFVAMTQTNNPNMLSGKIVQEYCDDILLNDVSTGEAFRQLVVKLQEFTPLYWHDQEQENAVIDHRLAGKYTLQESGKYKIAKAGEIGDSCEIELVCQNALAGLREATTGINKLEGEQNLLGELKDCTLPYNGRPDYSGRIELKTQWDKIAYSDRPSVNSLPREPRREHLAQVAGYWALTGLMPTLVYANRLSYSVHYPTQEILEETLEFIVKSCKRREKLLRATKTVEELLELCDPEWDHRYQWNGMHPDILRMAKKYG